MLQTPPRYTDLSLPPLDEADLKLISMLVADGRASGRDLAVTTGISEANVSRRLARLFEEKSIRVAGFVPPEYLGYNLQFAVFLRAKRDPEVLAARLAALPHFNMVVTTYGFCDVIAYGIAQHSPALVDLLDETVYGHNDVATVDVRAILEFTELSRQPGTPGVAASPRDLDPIDRRIIREAQNDGRISFTELAAAIGISPTSAADRFRRLLTDGIIRIMGLPDPYRVGLMLTGYMHVMVNRSAREVERSLEQIPELSFRSMMTGEWAIGSEIMVRDDRHYDQVLSRILAVPGVVQARMAIHRKMHKMNFLYEPVYSAEQQTAQAPTAPAHA